MTAKLTYNDIENNELDPSKLNFTAGFTNGLSSGTGAPSADAPVGGLYVDTSAGAIYRKTVAGAGAANWIKISSVSTTIQQNRYRGLTSNSAVTSTDATAPAFGDLVGYCGVGSWATSSVISVAKRNLGGAGSQNAALVAGGFTTTPTNVTELFNGSSWATSGSVLSTVRSNPIACGSQGATLVAGGVTTGVTTTNATELFNGATWSTSGTLSIAKARSLGVGSQNAGLIAGGDTNGSATNVTELFNGATWSTSSGNLSIAKIAPGGAGSQSAGLMAGGNTNGAATNVTELFNGSAWATSSVISIAKGTLGGTGSQSAGLIAGGFTSAATNVTELFNGSSWATSGVISIAKYSLASAGSQNAGLIAGGITTVVTNLTELHSQTTFRKIYYKEMPQGKNIGILSNTTTVLMQGTNTSVTYPANKYLILNRSLNSSVTNYTNVSALSCVSVLGTAPTMTYNLSSTANLLAVVPGMVAIVTVDALAVSPISAVNAGSFIISRVISPSSFEVQNPSGISENPATGTISIITTMIASDVISPQDIVIGKTDVDGLLTIQRPIIAGNLLQRLK